jgi:hypothetical protein
MSSTSVSLKLTERNYRQWRVEAEAMLQGLGLWKYVTGEMRVPRPPLPPSTSDASTIIVSSDASSSNASSPTRLVLRDPRDADYDFLPESTDSAYLGRFEHFLRDWERWQMNNDKAKGQIVCTMDRATQMRFPNHDDLKLLWEAIKSDFEKVIKLDGNYELAKLASCRLESYSTVAEWQATQESIIRDLATCEIEVNKTWRKFYITSYLPDTHEWTSFLSTLELTGKAETPAEIITHLLVFEAKLRRARGLTPDAALFISKKGRAKKSKTSAANSAQGHASANASRREITCYGCGEKGHFKRNCPNKDKLVLSRRSDANMASGDTESFLFSMVTINMASALASSDYWILDSGATNHVTGNRHLFESASFQPMAEGEHRVKTANNSLVDAKGTGTVSFFVEKPGMKPAKITLQNVLYIPECGKNNLLSVTQLIKKGAKFELTAGGTTISIGSTVVCHASINNGLFMLRAMSSVPTSIPTSVVLASSSEGADKACSSIQEVVDDKHILTWHTRLGHLSLPAIKRLPSIVSGIQLHSKGPSKCVCEACIMGKMFRQPFKAAKPEDKVKSRLLELIHSDVIGPMPTPTMRGFRYIIMFTDDYSRYTVCYFMKLKSEAPARFKDYVAMAERQHPNSKVCRIRVDGGGEYDSREQFLEYLAKEGIIREISAPYSQQQNGLSERTNRTIMDPARSMLKHTGMPNKLWAEAVATAVYIKNRIPTRVLPKTTPYQRWTKEKPNIAHLRVFGCLAYAWIHGDLRKKLDNHAYKCILLGYSDETSTQYRVMDVNSGRVFMARDVKFNETVLYHQLLKTSNQPRIILEPAEESPNDPPSPIPAKPFKSIELPPTGRIIPFDDSDDDSLSPPPETRESTPTPAPPNN